MAKKQDTNSIGYNIFVDRIERDITKLGKEENQWSFARNAVLSSPLNDKGNISNEQSNYLYMQIVYYKKEDYKHKNKNIKIIGLVHIQSDQWAVFSTDNVNSEIGLFISSEPKYITIVNDKSLNFSTYHLITGVARINHKCGRRVYWDDGVNPSRVIDIDDVPWKKTCVKEDSCKICKNEKELDVEKLRLAQIAKPMSFKLSRGVVNGNLINGAYFVVGAYVVDGQRITDYSLPSNTVYIYTHENAGGSLNITIDNVESDEFDEFELSLVQYANLNPVCYKLGIYSTSQNVITIDSIDQKLENIELGSIIRNNPIIDRSDSMFRNGDYLLRVGTTNKLDFNYQPLANQIRTNWVIVEYPMDYYKNGGTNVGYMRDEVYAFFIRWVYNTGDRSNAYHIPGRVADENEKKTTYPNGIDVFDYEAKALYPIWKINNTATVTERPYSEIAEDGEGVIIARGKMAYWESSEHYPDDKPEVWNCSSNPLWSYGWDINQKENYKDYDLCGKNIRHHKFPANDTDTSELSLTNHYNPGDKFRCVITDGNGYKKVEERVGKSIRVLGIEFSNIKPPLDNNGKVIENIIGYEIYRGNRDGNASVLAKGIFSNLREYKSNSDDGKTYLYPNYPYNALNGIDVGSSKVDNALLQVEKGVDHFISQEQTEFSKKKGGFNTYLGNDIPLGASKNDFPESERRLGNVRKDFLTFHSPDTMFRRPYITAKEIDIYGVAKGTMQGYFKIPEGSPKHKLITDNAFTTSTIIGLGYAIIKMLGEQKRTSETPQIDYGGTTSGAGVFYQSTGLSGVSAIPSAIMTGMNVIATAANTLVSNMLTKGVLTPIVLSTGINPNNLNTAIQSFTSLLSGSIGGKGGKTSSTMSDTEWTSTPFLVRALNAFPIFANYWAGGVDKTLDSIYAWIPYRHYVLQQMSHGFYDSFAKTESGSRRKEIKSINYLGTSLQNFTSEVVVNNLYRTRTVMMELEKPLEFTSEAVTDDSQVTLSDLYSRGSSMNWNDPENFRKEFTRNIASYYGAIKQRIDNQYGQLHSILIVPVSTKYYDRPGSSFRDTGRTPVQFGGDTFIGRYTEKNTMPFFYDWQEGEPDGTGFDYKLVQNVIHPRFWMNTNKFDPSEFVNSLASIFGSDEGGSAFDPFATNPIYTEEGGALNKNELDAEKNRINRDDSLTDEQKEEAISKLHEIKTCSCEVIDEDEHVGKEDGKQICLFTSTKKYLKLFKKICEAKSDLDDAQFDQAMLEAAACYAHQSIKKKKYKNDKDEECTPCNEDGEELSEFLDDEYSDKTKDDMTSWGKKKYNKITNSKDRWKKQRDRYNCADEGSIPRILKRAQGRVKKAQKKYDKKKEKLQDLYLENLSGKSSKGFVDKIKERVFNFPSDKYAFDIRQMWGNFTYSVNGGYMYLFNSGVRDFFVESTINIDFRDYGDGNGERFYNHTEFTNLDELFRTRDIKLGNYMKYDYSYSVVKNIYQWIAWAKMQTTDYDPIVSEKCYVYRPNRVVYSLPQFLEGKKDNWRIFLPLNYKEFTSKPTAIKQFGKMAALMTFETESPVYFDAVDQLSTDAGVKLKVGDGGLFSGFPQQMSSSEFAHEYGACKDRLSVINTPYGVFFISQDQGKIFSANYGQRLNEISMIGLNSWFYHYLPYQLLKDKELFIETEFELLNNPVVGIGCQAIYDNSSQTVYFCKKDWRIKPEFKSEFKYIGEGKFKKIGSSLTISLGDSTYFDDASWTISYNPMTKSGSFISWHDWKPDLVIPSKDTFMTIKDNGIWMHNDNCQSFCNFYGVDYPFEVEFEILQDNFSTETLRNIYYVMEAYVYDENCQDRFHVLDENFDEAIIYNSEQCSGKLRLKITPKNDPIKSSEYPIINYDSIDILVSKEEQLYKFNQFFDITDDRGEFEKPGVGKVQRTIFKTEVNGYVRNLNDANLNYKKSELEHKKFRHIKQNVILKKKISGNKNLVLSMTLIKKLNSMR